MSQPTAFKLRLIDGPYPFDFVVNKVNKEEETLAQKVSKATTQFFKEFSQILVQESWKKAKQVVYLTPLSIRIAILMPTLVSQLAAATALTVCFWVAMTLCAACYKMVSKLNLAHSNSSMDVYFPAEINRKHYVVKESDKIIDDSHVPEEIQVNNLLTMYEAINFTNKNAPGYIDEEKVNQEGPAPYDKLELLISYINNNTPFVGTPPASQPERLKFFYKGIRSGIRYVLNENKKELDNFLKARNGKIPEKVDYDDYLALEKEKPKAISSNIMNFLTGYGSSPKTQQILKRRNGKPPTKKDADDYHRYDFLLQEQGKLVLEFARAAGACGARWLGQLNMIFRTVLSSKKSSVVEEGLSLKDVISSLLQRERDDIALAQALSQTGANGFVDTHDMNAYLYQMKDLVGISQVDQSIEHLLGITTNQLGSYVEEFHQVYKPIETIQRAYKTSQVSSQDLRELICDWIKSQVGTWKEKEYQGYFKTINAAITANKQDKETSEGIDQDSQKRINILKALLKKYPLLKPPASGSKWQEFFEQIQDPKIKEFIESQLGLSTISASQKTIKRSQWQGYFLCADHNIQEAYAKLSQSIRTNKEIENAEQELKYFLKRKEKLIKLTHIFSEQDLDPPSKDILNNWLDLSEEAQAEGLKNHLKRLREREFLEAIIPPKTEEEEFEERQAEESAKANGKEYTPAVKLPKEDVFRWLLIQQGVLNPV